MTAHATLPRYNADPAALRRTFSYFPSGVVALVAEVSGAPQGMVASSFTVGVSLDPPLVSCAIQRSSSTWPLLRAEEHIGVSVLASDQGAMARRIASRNRTHRFDGVPLRSTGSSARFIARAPVWFEARVYGELPAGDHVMVLLEVVGLGADPGTEPLIVHGEGFRTLMLRESELPPSG